ncbi:MAG TPA: DPP IV N-terminal domain-containing protein [Terriglobales bacterium]|jgi:dipeptidyl aminopeptidase/acylaminoacyl peptidase
MSLRAAPALALILSCGLTIAAAAQAAVPQVTAGDYARAEKYLSYNTEPLVFGLSVQPQWLPDGRFWYHVGTPQGTQFVLVDPARGTREPAFDRDRLAAALASASRQRFSARALPLTNLAFSSDGLDVSFDAAGQRWTCDRQGAHCAAASAQPPAPSSASGPPLSISPDHQRAVFIRDYNLWMRNLATGAETQLTHDGVKNFGYATDNAGWISSDRPIVLWSPDSTKIATYQQDQRGVGKLYLVPVVVGHPTLTTEVYPLPGDPIVTTIQRVIIDLDSPGGPRVIRLQMPPDQHRSTLRDDLAFGPDEDVQWSPDGSTLAFISTSRGHHQEWLRVADAATGEVRTVYEETVSTEYEGGVGGSNFRYLPQTHEFLWYSQRDNWGQLYLYDLDTGKLKRQITTGVGNVDSVVYLDRKAREVYFIATGKQPGWNPYYQLLYKVSLDGAAARRGEGAPASPRAEAGGAAGRPRQEEDAQLLTPEDANHTVAFDPSGQSFVDTYSTPDTPPVTVLRDTSGKLVAGLEKADISRLLATGWKPPEQITVKARDGKTTLYGLMFTPFHMEKGVKYPIINHIYPGPQTGSVETRDFIPSHDDDEALAQLGFVVVEIDGMGTPWRGRDFHMAYYGNMEDNTLPDQVTGMQQLARRYKFIDINRAGIWGHSGGGDATADAMFRYPDFFKVGVAESGNHDQREYEDDWGERYMGLDVPIPGPNPGQPGHVTTYTGQSNESVAKNLNGHLLLAHGTMDNNVPMNNTLLVVQALIQANKDFDLILLPNQAHGYGPDAPYMMRRRWDYFVRYLMGATPPHEYQMHAPVHRR